jgi:hypothetical protein
MRCLPLNASAVQTAAPRRGKSARCFRCNHAVLHLCKSKGANGSFAPATYQVAKSGFYFSPPTFSKNRQIDSIPR